MKLYTVVVYNDALPIYVNEYYNEEEALAKQNELSKEYGYENVRVFVKEME